MSELSEPAAHFPPVTVAGRQLSVPIALGTMMWGATKLDSALAGRRGVLRDEEVGRMMRTAQDCGINFWDTAIGYGGGTSEERIGRVCPDDPKPLVMTKFLPTLWKWTAGQVSSDLDAALQRLGRAAPGGCVDVFMLHTPTHPRSVEFWTRQLARARSEGKAKAIGLSNCNADQIQRAVAAIHPEKIDLVQCHYSLLVGRSTQLARMVAVCREHDITIVGFSPVAQGLLVDGLTDERFKSNRIAKVSRVKRAQLDPLRRELSEIAEKRGVPMAQVAINWVACKGVVPLVGVRCVEHVEAARAALTWRLSPEEEQRLDGVAMDKSTFEKPRWQRGFALVFLTCLMLAYKVEAGLARCGIIRRPNTS